MSKIIDIVRSTQDIATIEVALNNGRTIVVEPRPDQTARDFLVGLNEEEFLVRDFDRFTVFATGVTVTMRDGYAPLALVAQVEVFAAMAAGIFSFVAANKREITVPVKAVNAAGQTVSLLEVVLSPLLMGVLGVATQNAPVRIGAYLK